MKPTEFSTFVLDLSCLFFFKSSLSISIKILSSEVTSKEWTESNQTIFVVFKKSSILWFDFCPVNHIILILTTNWFVEVVLLTNLDSFIYFNSIPVTSCPIKSQSLFNDFVEGSNNFFNGTFFIITMSIDNVNIVKLKSFQGSFQSFLHMLSAGGLSWVDIRVRISPDLGSNNQSLSFLSNCLEEFP